MYTLIGIIIVAIVILLFGSIYSVFKQKIKFYVSGFDSGFSILDLNLLWTVAQICDLENPSSLFWSLPSLTKCMEQITSMKNSQNSTDEEKQKNQILLSKLFAYRTKIQNEADSKKGLSTTLSLENNQKLRIILPGKGVFTSKILNNGKQMIISLPKRKDMIEIPAEEWVDKIINIYLWRKADARYVFDTVVSGAGIYIGQPALFIKHSNNLVRTQKRKAVRAKCEIYGQLYIIKKEPVDYSSIETQNGYRCLLEDISESGALIRIGGKGISNVQIKLQFNIQNMLILMFGTIKNAVYNEEKNESELHFECTHIDQAMKNEVLSFVYNMLPEQEKEVIEALKLTEEDVQSDQSNSETETSESSASEENKSIGANSLSTDNSSASIKDSNKNVNEEFEPPVVYPETSTKSIPEDLDDL